MDRPLQAGDLVRDASGKWRVLTARDLRQLNRLGEINLRADCITLLAASDVPLWDALCGLPRTHVELGGNLWIALGGRPGTGCSGMLYRRDGSYIFQPARRSFSDDLPELKQAIQRFEALQQYIKQHKEATE